MRRFSGALMDRVIEDVLPLDGSAGGGALPAVLQDVAAFGSNPGNLRMRLYVPVSSGGKRRPLVVALHGCTQTAEGFDKGSGWSRLAERHGFLLLLPEQRAVNNQNACFSWFEPGDTRRGEGEVESIRQMIATAVADDGADPKRVFICGLSAGGAMAGAMLAVYPEIFAGGAMIAGLPYGAAASASEAFDSMFTGRTKEPRIWGDAVRAASDHRGPWPSVAVWHGSADTVVKPINAGELVKQWTNVHGIGAEVPCEDHVGAVTRRIWRDKAKHARVTEYSVPGLGHGVPVDGNDPPAPFFLPAGISSTDCIARDWGLIRETRPWALLSLLGLNR